MTPDPAIALTELKSRLSPADWKTICDYVLAERELMEAYAAEKVEEALDWRPIETAPRDGTEFLGYHLSTDYYTGDWSSIVEYSGDPEWPWEDYEGIHPVGFLTHWKPINPPTNQHRGCNDADT